MNTIDGIDFGEYLEMVGHLEAQELVPLADFSEQAWAILEHGDKVIGDPMPWPKTHNTLRFRPAEVTLWAGINGHGKSLILSHVTAYLSTFCRVAVASFEMPPDRLLARLVRQVAGTDQVFRTEHDRIMAALGDRYWLYNVQDTVTKDKVLGMCVYAFRELGCKHVVIDSLVKCGMRNDDYNAQKEFTDRLAWVARGYQGHIHVIHHMRKGEKEQDHPDKFDVKGAGEIVDLVDNLFIHFRNKKKEKAAAIGKTNPDDPDAILIVAKNRNGGWEGEINLWYDKASGQFLEYPYSSPMRIF